MKRFLAGFFSGIVFTIAVSVVWLFVASRTAAPPSPPISVRNGRYSPPFPQAAAGGDLHVALGGKLGHDVVFSRKDEEFASCHPKVSTA